jgi:glycolate dehydrogenase FAD-linked subunit
MGGAGVPLAELISICGPERVITEHAALRTYESDGLLQYAVVPAAAVLPDTAEEVAAVVAACHRAGVPWVARGSGTGLSGGSLPVEGGVVISLSRMRRILDVDLANQRILVEPGVTNAQISAAVGPSHFYPPDPSSQIICSIGGNVAENSGGVHCFKYGFTTNWVVGCEVVLPDGSTTVLGSVAGELDRPGYDLLGTFVGSEGTLGVATKITLRITPAPEATRTVVAYFDTPEQAGQVVSDVVSAGVVPGAMEIMDNLAIAATEAATNAGNPLDAGALLIVELDGSESECDARFDEVVRFCKNNGATGVRIAQSEDERALIWKARKAAFAAMGRISPNFYVQDGVIPRTRLPQVLRKIEDLGTEYGLRVANVFHAGDGNLHPLVLYDGAVPGEAERAEKLAGRIVEVCVEEGGSLTGEHGIGVDKKRYMPKMFSEADLATFQRLRCAFDPEGMVNPGKVMPTPRLCGEVPGPYRQHPLEAAGVIERL